MLRRDAQIARLLDYKFRPYRDAQIARLLGYKFRPYRDAQIARLYLLINNYGFLFDKICYC